MNSTLRVEPVSSASGLGHVDAQRIDSCWSEQVADAAAAGLPILIDLSEADYLNHDVLLYLVALVSKRNRNGEHTQFLFPDTRHRNSARRKSALAIRDYLGTWKFDEALKYVSVDYPVHHYLHDSQKSYFEEAGRPKYQRFKKPGSATDSSVESSFFALTPLLSLSSSVDDEAFDREESFEDPEVEGVLERFLGARSALIKSMVVFEAVHNAGSHRIGEAPAKGLIGSQLMTYRRTEDIQGSDRQFVVSIWDDGPSFAETLQLALRNTGNIKSEAYGAISSIYQVKTNPRSTLRPYGQLTSEQLPLNEEEEALILSAFTLGITSRSGMVSKGKRSNAEIPHEWVPPHLQSGSGVGLYVLTKTAVDEFGGSVSYFSGSHRFEVRPSSEQDYDYQIVSRPRHEADPKLDGNLLVVRFNLDRLAVKRCTSQFAVA